MGVIMWIIAVFALILSITAIFLQAYSPAPIDFQQCTIMSTTSGNPPAQTTCNDICGQKTCLFGLSKFSETLTIPNTQPEMNYPTEAEPRGITKN
ncbi:MAG: hypothetical protein UR98_C0040G0035 [Parcubacteria group bacterium GW2011_GWA1_36_12]|nr:MAG: hypothetical protein UR98_C0040G0035 [Parcubacteria group bacterium GW2011_GWA1_36_12]